MTALLRHVSSGRTSVLRAEHLVGRSARCDLSIDAEPISAQHAAIRWNGEHWEIRDLGSRNGTYINDTPLTAGEDHLLEKNAVVRFGGPEQSWRLVDDSAPRLMAVLLETERVALPDGELLAIPSSEAPETVLFRDTSGAWVMEGDDGTLSPIKDQDRIVTSAGVWLFCCPHIVAPTSVLAHGENLSQASLVFEVSRDEEHVELTVHTAGKRLPLGVRIHNYLMLTLARHRLEDRSNGFVPSACGWVYVEDLVTALRTEPERLNLDIFRIRQQFGRLGFDNPAAVIERRPRTRQLRLGIQELTVRPI